LEWVEIYKKDFFDQRADTPESRSTWSDHFKILKKLPEDKGLTPQVLKDVLLSTSPDSRNRQKATRILSKLAELAEIPVALSSYSGNYGLKSLDPRHLPSDEEILEWREKISSPEWQLVYSLLAAYGLRPHELAYLLLDTPPALNILDGKTGPRIAYPCPSTWVNDWALNSLALLPPLAGKDNSAIGNKVTKAFGRLEIPFKPYDLRHCWAIRSIQYFEPVIAAAIMGHSLQTHNQRYHRWLNAEHLKTAFERSKAGD
jgi:integrase